MYIGKTPTVGNFQVCDAISVVNGQAAYTLQVGGVNVAPESANHMLVSLNGILQKPGSSFTISGSTMTFASNLATGDVIDFVQILGNVLDIGQPSDDTVKTASIQANAVTGAKLNTDVISAQTALTDSPADTDELLISDAGTIKRIDVSLVGGKNTPSFSVTQGSAQDISNATATKLAFNTEVFDTDSAFDHSSNYRFTVPSGKGGKYFISVNFGIDDCGEVGDILRLRVFKNGSNMHGFRGQNVQASSNYILTTSVSGTVTLSAGDVIKCMAYTDSNVGDANIEVECTSFSMFRLSI